MKQNDPYAALRFPEFKAFITVRFALVFAWAMQFVVIEWEVYRLTQDPLSLGIIGLMEVVPAVSMALFAGHIVDQSEKRNLLLISILAFSGLSLGLFYMTLPSVQTTYATTTVLYGIYGLVFLGGFVRAFISPTLFSLMALIVPKEHYPNAATWSSSAWQMGGMLGPALAGFSIHWIGAHQTLFLIVGFAATAFLLLLTIKKKPILNKKIGEPVLESLREGIRFVFNTKVILGAITLDMVAVLFGGAIALLPVFATDILGVDAQGFGILRAAPAVGSFLIMLSVAYFPINKNAGKKLLAAIFGFGLCIIVFGLSKIFWLSVFALFMSGVTDGVSMVIRQTILQLYTPDEMRGRVASVNSMFIGSSNELGAFESGFTAKLMGPVVAVVFGGCMTLLTVGFTGLMLPSMRNLDIEEKLEGSKEADSDLGEHLVD
jgi:MFS family permease